MHRNSSLGWRRLWLLPVLGLGVACGDEAGSTGTEALPLGVRSPTGLITLEWDPSAVLQRIDGFSIQTAPESEGPFTETWFLDHSRRTLVDITHEEGDRTFYRVQGLQGSRVVSESEVSAATSTVALPTTVIEQAPGASLQINNALFRFSGQSMIDGQVAMFTSRLDSEPWSEPTLENEVELNALSIGPHVFQVRAIDSLGNVDPTPSHYAFTVNLEGNPRVTINNGLVATMDNHVNVLLAADGAVTEMKIGEDPDLSGVEWEPFANNFPVTLSTGEGTKTLYAQFRLENDEETVIVSDSIIVDRTPPTGDVSFPFDGQAFYQDAVSVYGSVVDVSPVTIRIGDATDEALATTFTLSEIPLAIGDNHVLVELEDAVGLQSTIDVVVWRHPAIGVCAFD